MTSIITHIGKEKKGNDIAELNAADYGITLDINATDDIQITLFLTKAQAVEIATKILKDAATLKEVQKKDVQKEEICPF